MKAIVFDKPGGTEVLKLVERPLPSLGDNEVLVKVQAFSINPVDIKTRLGKSMYKELSSKTDSIILGWDIAGTVTKVGNGVTSFHPGDEVFGMINFPGYGAAYAEYVAAPATHLAHKPAAISFEDAAAATLAALTAWQAIVHKAKVRKGQRVLIHGAAGGVGHYAVQIAKLMGAFVIGTSSAANRNFVLSLGADEHIDYRNQKIEDHASDIDFALDTIGGENVASSLAVTKKSGTVIVLPSANFSEGMSEKAKALGIDCYFYMVSSNEKDIADIARELEAGHIRSHVSAVFPFDKIADAHAQIETGRTVGKIVVNI